jgi:hypothetical protein
MLKLFIPIARDNLRNPTVIEESKKQASKLTENNLDIKDIRIWWC